MSEASDNFENALAELFFKGTPWPNVADNAASSPIANWQMGLHSASPGEGGNQTTNEIGYTGYTRKSVSRSGTGFSVTGGVASFAANQDFPIGSGGSGTASHMSLGNASSSTGVLQLYGAISPSIACGNGVTPRLTTGSTFTVQ